MPTQDPRPLLLVFVIVMVAIAIVLYRVKKSVEKRGATEPEWSPQRTLVTNIVTYGGAIGVAIFVMFYWVLPYLARAR